MKEAIINKIIQAKLASISKGWCGPGTCAG